MSSARFVTKLALRNLRSDWFGTLSAIIGVALGTATVNVVLTLDVNTRAAEARSWSTNPDLAPDLSRTVALRGVRADGTAVAAEDAAEETHEDYQVMRSAIRLGSLSAFLVGALIVFFTFRVVVEQRRREIALLRSLGSTRTQVALIYLTEAALIGAVGATLGALLTGPLTFAAAFAGITTTGRARLYWVFIPWRLVAAVSAVGAGTAVLGVLRPLLDVLRLDVSRTLRPQFIDRDDGGLRKRTGAMALVFPFMALLYVLIRPFFVEVLPSLAFFVLEAGLVCAGFLGTIVTVPQVVAGLGFLVGRIIPSTPHATRLLTLRRIERSGHEVAWAVSGVMLVFALLLSLHVVTRSLKDEVIAWASTTVRDQAYVVAHRGRRRVPPALLARLPERIIRVAYSGRTPRPNTLIAVDREALVRFARDARTPDATALERLRPGAVVLSRMMSRRLGIEVGDRLHVDGRGRSADLEVVAVTDFGYLPMEGPYRDSKTYGLIASEDFDLIAPYAAPLGAAFAFRDPAFAAGLADPHGPWPELLGEDAFTTPDLLVEIGTLFELDRIRETDKDFAIFDVILLLTALLAGVGIANNLVLSAHVRRREIALLRVLGMRPRQIQILFLLEGALIGGLGGALAVLLGVPLGFAAVSALEVVSAFQVRFTLPPSYALNTVLGAVIVALLAALYPALRSPRAGAESMHYE